MGVEGSRYSPELIALAAALASVGVKEGVSGTMEVASVVIVLIVPNLVDL